MAEINLTKGQKVDLTKGTSQSRFYIGLGWNAPAVAGGNEYDLDVSAIILGADGKLLAGNGKNFVFYNNLKSPTDAVIHTGDNLTGAGDGDDEVLYIDVSKLPPEADEVSILVTIHDAAARGNQNFGAIKRSYIRIAPLNDDNSAGSGDPQVRYDLDEDASMFTAMHFGSIYKKDGEWRFDAVGQGFPTDLGGLLKQYGAM